MSRLKAPFVEIESQSGKSYGGSQNWFQRKFLQKVGCGVISAANLLIHLQGKKQMSETEYVEFAKDIWLRYFPVIPGFGMNGLTLMNGLNRYFHKHRLPYRAFWAVSGRKMLKRIDLMLENDLPVILSVGPNFPFFWGKQKLTFYKKSGKQYVPAVKTKAHFVTATGREGIYLKISSWGQEYYIDIREYREYVKRCSSPLVSNIICIKKKKTIQ